ncbi:MULTISPECIES: hypothetical protein [unclassified Dysgonomonas]|uniref:hypothetical protein n=1 Tax=unclassified Dysgonomonas TaxID=2630389 RepID=UPI0025B8E40D|nr:MULTISPECIES: hypothetical protein [unclassified Dysgonomonas]HMM02733.1 hypothetical protein [Dysgonomonas sp.]
MSVLTAPNGALYNIPDEPGAKAEYTRVLLDSLVSPFLTPSAMDAGLVNNFVSGTDPLSGAQQSNLLGLDVVMESSTQVDSIATRLADSSGGNKTDWIALITGLWQTAKQSNIFGTAKDQQKIEGELGYAVGAVVADTVSQKVARFIRDNFLLVVGGTVTLILFIAYSLGKRR